VNCREVREALPAYAREERSFEAVGRHLETCPACLAELERYETLLDSLSGLRTAVVEPPPGLLTSLMNIPHQAGLRDRWNWRSAALRAHVARNKGVYLGGAAALGAAGAALWRTRARRLAAA
jgi:hypothetical protein